MQAFRDFYGVKADGNLSNSPNQPHTEATVDFLLLVSKGEAGAGKAGPTPTSNKGKIEFGTPEIGRETGCSGLK